MAMSERIQALRRQSLETDPSLSAERAVLLTRFFQQASGLEFSPGAARQGIRLPSGAQGHLDRAWRADRRRERARTQAAPTYPELCCHSQQDLDILDTRPKIPFSVSEEVKRVYREEIIPFWEGRAIRDRIFAEMTAEWKDAYEAGIFTEFMEQRSPGHTVLDDKIYHKGMLDFCDDIDAALAGLDFLNDPQAYARQEDLKAMRICALALIRFAGRHADRAEQMAAGETDPARKAELEQVAAICRRVPAHSPATFHEALQYYWFVHLGVTIELNTWDSFDPGRLDQHLEPFYRRETSAGSLTRERAAELLECFWIKFNNQPAPPKVGVTAAESGTYTDFAQINLGGVKVDGSDGVNEVTYLLLDVVKEMRLLQPSASIQVSKKNPDRFIQRAARIIRTGFGQPSIFNADAIVQELVRQGKSIGDARQAGSSGCVEIGAFGKENYTLTGYFNLPKVLEITLQDGCDPRTGKQIGLRTGDPRNLTSFAELFAAFEKQLRHFVDIKVRGNQVIERLYASYMPAPFLSLLIDDCVARGRDYHDGGARYNSSYIQGVGLGSITDELSGLKYHVFDQKTYRMEHVLAVLEKDFAGEEAMRLSFANRTPRYGNDDEYADNLMRMVFEAYYRAIEGRKNTRGGEYHINLLPTTCHVYFGAVTGATTEGRRAGKPLSEGISPVQGADRRGPTAVLRSAGKLDHLRTGGTLLNMKLTPELLKDEEGLTHLVQLVRTYFKLDGHHIQFNVVDAETLRKAQQHPEEYRDLIVRVAGYSDYFCNLSKSLQEEIITRTEQKAF